MSSIISVLKPEEQLLLYISSPVDINKDTKEGLLTDLHDWNNFIHLANAHGIIAMTCHNMEKLGLLKSIPPEPQNTIRTLYLKSLARNTFLTGKFIELKNNLAEIGIEPVVLKGMALEPSVYGNKGLRQMNDIDIFIRDKNECLEAWKHLRNRGYEASPLKSPLYKKILPDFGKHLPDLNKDGISYDLHYSIFDVEWDIKTLKIPAGKKELKIPDYDIHFLYLVKHLDDHEMIGGSQLRLYLDLVQILMMPGKKTSASHLMSLAEKLNMEDILLKKLYLLNLFWNVPVDEAILDKLNDDQKEKATKKFIAFLRNPKGRTGMNKGMQYRKTLRNIPTLRKKLIFLLGDIFPSISFMQERYRTKTRIGACVYYPVRLGKLLLLIKR